MWSRNIEWGLKRLTIEKQSTTCLIDWLRKRWRCHFCKNIDGFFFSANRKKNREIKMTLQLTCRGRRRNTRGCVDVGLVKDKPSSTSWIIKTSQTKQNDTWNNISALHLKKKSYNTQYLGIIYWVVSCILEPKIRITLFTSSEQKLLIHCFEKLYHS